MDTLKCKLFILNDNGFLTFDIRTNTQKARSHSTNVVKMKEDSGIT